MRTTVTTTVVATKPLNTITKQSRARGRRQVCTGQWATQGATAAAGLLGAVHALKPLLHLALGDLELDKSAQHSMNATVRIRELNSVAGVYNRLGGLNRQRAPASFDAVRAAQGYCHARAAQRAG